MLQVDSCRVSAKKRVLHATAEDFEQVFAIETTDLLRLSLLLTADAEKAENCLILAKRDCCFRSSVLKDRVHKWARRMVMRNAIRLVLGTRNDIVGESAFEFHLQPSDYRLEAMRESVAILTLPDLDRLVFVICVLERLSILDCALLLRKTAQEVDDAILRATSQILPREGPGNHEVTTTFSGDIYGASGGVQNKLISSCGSIFD